MNTQEIVNAIQQDFTKTYKNATPFVGSGELWDFCIDTIADPIKMSCIAFANDLGIPPVRSLITFYARETQLLDTFFFTGQQAQFMGALMGFVFKFVLLYQQQKERCSVNEWGIKTATRFMDGPVVKFQS